MDGYSRKILDRTLCENMEGINIELLVARVKKKYQEAKARIIHDNGKQFISKDFKSLVSLLELYETATRVCHPQSNGILERKTSYCRYKQKSLLAATAAGLKHLISFPKKVQVHFGQDNHILSYIFNNHVTLYDKCVDVENNKKIYFLLIHI